MITRILILFSIEIAKLARQKVNYLYLLAAAFGPVIFQWGLTLTARTDQGRGFANVASSIQASLGMLGVLLAVVFSASLVTHEKTTGTIRAILVLPLKRAELVVAKLFVAFAFSGLLLAVTTVASVAAGMLFFDYGPVCEGNTAIYGEAMLWRALFLGAALSILPLMAASSYGLLFSCWMANTGAALGSAVTIFVLLDMLKARLGIAPVVFTTYVGSPMGVVADIADGFDFAWSSCLRRVVPVCAGWIAICAIFSVLAIRRKDFTL